MPRLVTLQTMRPSPPIVSGTAIIMSTVCCSCILINLNKNYFDAMVKIIQEFYETDNFEAESNMRYKMSGERKHQGNMKEINLVDILGESYLLPAITRAIKIATATACTIERSFSPMRRIQTWLRDTMSNSRLSGLCLLSVHQDRLQTQKSEAELIEK
ncbi:hypothetical protein PR048_006116, partial [Dryococelus australis]